MVVGCRFEWKSHESTSFSAWDESRDLSQEPKTTGNVDHCTANYYPMKTTGTGNCVVFMG